MKQIPLTQGKIAIVDDQDADLSEMKWHFATIGYATHTQYIKGQRAPQMTSMHRVIMARKLGRSLIKGEIVDHANHDTLDNRRDNLRIATKSKNAWNSARHSDNQTGYKGVYITKHVLFKKWRARIRVNGKNITIGSYYSAEEAARAYDTAARKYFGEFALVNFPS